MMVFYVYIRLKNTPAASLPEPLRQSVSSNLPESTHLSCSVCGADEIEDCIAAKAKLWKDFGSDLGGAELVVHQIRTSNGGFDLSPATVAALAEANLTLCVTHSVINLK